MTEIDPQDQVTSFSRNGSHPTKTSSRNTIADERTSVDEGAKDLDSNGNAGTSVSLQGGLEARGLGELRS
jgi:hypothetical protein